MAPQLEAALNNFPVDIEAPTTPVEASEITELEDHALSLDRNGNVVEAENFKQHPPVWAGKAKLVERARDYIGLRDILKAQYDLEGNPDATDKEIEANRRKLKALYDKWVKKHGELNLNRRLIKHLENDPDFYTVLGLETVVVKPDPDDVTKTVEIANPAAVLSGRVIHPDIPPEKAESVDDALAVSLSYRGVLDINYMQELTGLPRQAIETELIRNGQAFRDPESGRMMIPQEYLVGNVREKLQRAIFAAKEDTQYQRNIDALKAVIPPDQPFDRIKFNLGGRWIPVSVINSFSTEVMGMRGNPVTLIPKVEEFAVSRERAILTAKSNASWSTNDMDAVEILEHALNMKRARIMKRIDDKYVLDDVATNLAQQLIDNAKLEFERYARTTEDRVDHKRFDENKGDYVTTNLPVWHVMEDAFNVALNSFVVPDNDGSMLKLPGLSEAIRRTPHLLNGIMRAIQTGSAVFGHGVGSGKTFLNIIASHELKRIGLAKKPVLIIKKPTVGQYRESIERAYPGSNILIPSQADFDKANRRKLIARIASGRFDFILLTHEQMKSIRASDKAVTAFFESQITDLRNLLTEIGATPGIEDAKSTRGEPPDVKSIVKKIKSLRKRQSKMQESMAKHQNVGLTWEQLGIDAIFVDEAHNFKKMPIITRQENVKGIPTAFSQRAVDLLIKLRDVQRRTGGRNVFFSSGTPVSNTLAELWVMFYATNPALLVDFDIPTFDNFATAFAETVTQFEFGWDNKFKDVTRMAKFKNGAQLTVLTRTGMDVKIGNKELGLDVPDMEGGKPSVVVARENPAFNRWIQLLIQIADRWAVLSPMDRRLNSWVPITAMRAGAAAALDPRSVFLDPSDPAARTADPRIVLANADHPGSKVNTAIADIFKEWEAGKERKTTMMVFADLYRTLNTQKLMNFLGGDFKPAEMEQSEDDVPDPEPDDETDSEDTNDTGSQDEEAFAKNAVGSFNLYDDIRTKLIKMGVPAHEIAVATEHDTDSKREALFNKVRVGIVRILLGSTEKIGEGVDVPQRMSAQFHLDPPMQMTPAKLEQRIGRIIRQGNLHSPKNWNQLVRVILYAQQRSMDAPIYQMLERKGKMVLQALQGQYLGDEFEDPASELTYAMAELIAEATGDKRAVKLAELNRDVRDLTTAESVYLRRVSELRRSIETNQRDNRYAQERAEANERLADGMKRELETENPKMVHPKSGQIVTGWDEIDKWLETNRPIFEDAVKNPGTEVKAVLRFGNHVEVTLEGTHYKDSSLGPHYSADIKIGQDTWHSQLNTIESLPHALKGIPRNATERAQNTRREIESTEKSTEALKAELAKTKFDKGDELARKKKELAELQDELSGKTPPAPPVVKEFVPDGSKRAPPVSRRQEAPPSAALTEEITEIEKPLDLPPGPSPDAMASVAGAIPENPLSEAQVEATVGILLGGQSPALVVVVNNPDAKTADGQPAAGWYENGKVYINRAFIGSRAELRRVLQEELLHAIRNDPEVQTAWRNLLASLTPEQRQQAEAQYPGASEELLDEEAVIDRIEALTLSPEQQTLWARFWAAVKDAIAKLPGVRKLGELFGVNFDDTDARRLVARAWAKGREGRAEPGAVGPAKFSVPRVATPETGRKVTTAVSWVGPTTQTYAATDDASRIQAATEFVDFFGDDLEAAQKAVNEGRITGAVTMQMSQLISTELVNRFGDRAMKRPNVIDAFDDAMRARQSLEAVRGELSVAAQSLQAGQTGNKMLGGGFYLVEWMNRMALEQARRLAGKFPSVTADRLKLWLEQAARDAVKVAERLARDADALVSKALNRARQDYGETWREIMTKAATRQGDIQDILFEAVSEHPLLQNLPQDARIELAVLLGRAWTRERNKLIRIELEKATAVPGVSAADKAKLLSELPELIRLLNLGLLDFPAFLNAMAPKYGVRAMTAEGARAIYDLGQTAQAKPEGAQQNTAIQEVYREIARRMGVPLSDVLTSYWYASVLAGMGTQGRNFLGNAALLLDNFIAFSARSPLNTFRFIGGFLRGMRMNAQGEFGAVLKRGQGSDALVGADVRGAGNTLEAIANDQSAWLRFFGNFKYVSRFMIAVDSFFYAANAEMQATFSAIQHGREAGLTGAELDKFVSDLLAVDPESDAYKMADIQAHQEAADGLLADHHEGTIARRRNEILRFSRPPEIQQEMKRFGLEATLNQEPEGLIGGIANAILKLRAEQPWLTFIVPFVRISANVTNMLLDHSPAGLLKLVLARPEGYLTGLPDKLRYRNARLTPEQWEQLRAKVIISHAVMMALAMKAAAEVDDDDPDFQVTGTFRGLTPEQRRQLEAQGIKPYQVRIGGVGFDYRQSPGALLLATLGNWLDLVRYTKFAEKENKAELQLAAVLAAASAVIVDQQFLSGIATLIGTSASGAQEMALWDKLLRTGARTVGGLIPQFTKELDTWVEPNMKQAQGFFQLLQREVPIARWSMDNQANVLGQPIERRRTPTSWLISGAPDDPLWQVLGEKAQAGVFIPVVSASATVLRNGKRVKMTDETFDKYQREVGTRYEKVLRQNIDRIKGMTPPEFDRWIKRTTEPIREAVRRRL